jgi:hypothetical protein
VAQKSENHKIIGVGLDGADGHVRITRAKVFHLFGGSDETHARMQESCVRFTEKLDARGKRLGELGRQELRDLAAECNMNLLLPPVPADKGRQKE